MKTLNDVFQVEQFDNLEWVSKQVVEGFITGQHKSPYHGFSVEFAEHRLYNQGESTRYVDWKLFARTEKLFVKRFDEETNLRCMLVIDTSSSMLFPFNEKGKVNKLNFSVYSAAALIHLMRRQRDAVGITLFSNQVELQTAIKLSDSHSKMLYTELNRCLNRDKQHFNLTTDASSTLHQVAENIHKRSLVVIFSDMFTTDMDQLFRAIEHLRYNKHEVVIFHVTDKQHESELGYQNRPTRFVDMETGESIKLNPNEIRDTYHKSMANFNETLRLKCGQYKIDLIEADVALPFSEVLIPFLVKRKNMY